MKQIQLEPKAFTLTQDDVDFVIQKATEARDKGAQEITLQGEHEEGAIVTVKGHLGLYNQQRFESGEDASSAQVFVFHDTLVNQRHKVLSEKLIVEGAIKLKDDDKDYLYAVLTETTESHLFEIAKRLAKGLPLYVVKFDEDGDFDLEFQGNI